jgi:hypothetical protein
MPNNFTIVISASDKATATVRKVNDAMSRLSRPFDQVGKSFKGLGRELGFEKIGKNLGAIGSQAAAAARSVGSILAPMAAITGVASVAGVVALADSWANLGRSITYSAGNIGTSTDQLQAFQGAAKLAGLSSDAMTGSLQSLSDTMEDAVYGRNQQALMLFNRLGVGIKRTKDGAMDATGEFKALAGAISRLKTPQQQSVAAREFGLTALLPLIRQGPAAFDKLMAKARELGMVMDGKALEDANEFAGNLDKLKASGEGLRNSIGNAIIPAIKPLVDQLGAWVSRNRELISSKVGEWARDFGKWVQSVDWAKVGKGITDMASGVSALVDKMGGIKGVAIAAGAVLGAGFAANVIALTYYLGKMALGIGAVITKFGGMSRAAKAAGDAAKAAGSSAGAAAGAASSGWLRLLGGLFRGPIVPADSSPVLDRTPGLRQQVESFSYRDFFSGKSSSAQAANVSQFFQRQGWSAEQSAGLAANFARESKFNPAAVGDNGQAYGIGQWHPDRQAAFAKWAGKSIRGSSLEEQMRFAQYELTQGGEQKAGAMLRNATSARDAGAILSKYYERPADAEGEASSRGALADFIRQQKAAPTGPYSQGSATTGVTSAPAAPNGSVHVEVELKNAPPGTQVKATPKGDVTASARIGYSAVGAMA